MVTRRRILLLLVNLLVTSMYDCLNTKNSYSVISYVNLYVNLCGETTRVNTTPFSGMDYPLYGRNQGEKKVRVGRVGRH